MNLHQFKRYGAVTLLLVGGLFVLFLLSLIYTPAPRNLIVISLDSVRADHLDVLGYPRATMPALSAWAKDGAFVFSNYFATSYLTPISEVSVQTGESPFTTGVVNFAAAGRPTVPLLAELLKEKGYDTAAFGSSPEYLINDALKATFSRGFDTFDPYPTTTPARKPGQPRVIGRTLSKPIDDAVKWLDGRKASKAPFYLWLPLGSAHAPYILGKPIHFTDPSYKGPLASVSYDEFNTLYGFLYNGKRYDTKTMRNSSVIGTYSDTDLQYVTDRYDDGLYLSDQIISKLFEYLKQSGLDKNTIVVFESEHGESLGERGYIWHYDVYDETLHAPLIMHIPGMNGKRVDALMSGVDIMPTLLSALHLPAVPVEGKNYLPLMKGASKTPPRDTVVIARTPLWERVTLLLPYFNAVDDVQHFHDTAVRSNSFKLIHRTSARAQVKYGWWGMLTGTPVEPPEYELYDLKADPGEKNNVYESRKGEPDVEALQAELDAYDRSVTEHMPGQTHSAVQPYF